MLNTLRHLLPDSAAWRLVVERTLKKYLRGVASVGGDAVEFVDDVSDDLYPQTTRELTEWLKQFGIEQWAWGNEADMRNYLEFRWGEDRGQSPKHLQDKLRAAGFDAYVYDSFDMADVSLSTFTGDTMTVGAQDFNPRGFNFAAGGQKLYMVGGFNAEIYQYSLSEPYDLSTALYDSVFFDPSTQDNNPFDVKVSPDGTKMFILGGENDSVYEYDLPTPFSIASPTYVDALSVTAKETIPQGFHWKPDGTEVYVTGTASDHVHQYTLGTAWDVSTAAFTRTYDPTATNPISITFNEYGTVMLLMPLGSETIYQWNLSTPWDISTATSSGNSLLVSGEDTYALYAKLENNKLFMLGTENWDIYRYRFGAWRDPLTYAAQPIFGNTQCGDDGSGINPVAECGEQPPNQDTLDSATCNALLANEVWYLVNKQLTDSSPPSIPTDNSKWGPFWYVGGTPIGTELEVDEYDRERFEKLCLRYGPAEDWIVTIIDVWRTTYISEWQYQVDGLGSGLSTGKFRFSGAGAAYIADADDAGTDQTATLSILDVGEKLRFLRSDDGTWIEYVTTSSSADNTTYWAIAYNPTATDQSSDWAGFPSAGTKMQIYRRKAV